MKTGCLMSSIGTLLFSVLWLAPAGAAPAFPVRSIALMTSAPTPVAAGGDGSGATYLGSAQQLPALTVPAGFVNGLPIGLLIMGRQWTESQLIQYAFAYEQVTHYRRPPPPGPN